MVRYNLISLLLITVLASLLLAGGCAGSAQKQAPHMGFGNFDVRTELTREDIVVLDRVEGTSTTTSILVGAIQIIDGDKWKLLWLFPFFKEKYTYFNESGEGVLASTADRAYYKALEAAPDADALFPKSMDHENEGIPFIWETKTITWKGKAIKLVSDQ